MWQLQTVPASFGLRADKRKRQIDPASCTASPM